MFTPDFNPRPWPAASASDAAPVTVYAPATLANCAAGFDSLGAALAPVDGALWGDRVTAVPAPAYRLRVAGPCADAVPADEGNLVLQAAARFSRALGSRGSRTRG